MLAGNGGHFPSVMTPSGHGTEHRSRNGGVWVGTSLELGGRSGPMPSSFVGKATAVPLNSVLHCSWALASGFTVSLLPVVNLGPRVGAWVPDTPGAGPQVHAQGGRSLCVSC